MFLSHVAAIMLLVAVLAMGYGEERAFRDGGGRLVRALGTWGRAMHSAWGFMCLAYVWFLAWAKASTNPDHSYSLRASGLLGLTMAMWFIGSTIGADRQKMNTASKVRMAVAILLFGALGGLMLVGSVYWPEWP